MDDAVDQLRADHDATPYTSNSFPQSAPAQLAAIAHSFGLETPDVSREPRLCLGEGELPYFGDAAPEEVGASRQVPHVALVHLG
jgi:hypothetical protein